MFVECFNCGGTGMICEFCGGDKTLYESQEYPDDLYRLEEIFPMQGREVACPVCNGAGEMFVGDDDDLELQDS
jgi:hypothetical protein